MGKEVISRVGASIQCGLGPGKEHQGGCIHPPSAVGPSSLRWQPSSTVPLYFPAPLEEDLNVLRPGLSDSGDRHLDSSAIHTHGALHPKGMGAGHCFHPSLSCPRPISSLSGPHPISESGMTNPHMNPHYLQNKVQESSR